MDNKDLLWIPIRGYEGYYEVMATGKVRSIDRVILTRTGRRRALKGRVLKPKVHNDGYEFYTLSKDNKSCNLYAHRLVAELFVPNPFYKPIVNHIDGDPKNNVFYNLEWVTHQENVIHAYETGLNNNKGASHYMSVRVVDKWTGSTFSSIREWSRARCINYSTARNILNGYSSLSSVNGSLVCKVNSDDYE